MSNQPVFPQDKIDNHGIRMSEGGMTLRDYFAAKAMQGMLAASENYANDELANFAYLVADAMLKAREQ